MTSIHNRRGSVLLMAIGMLTILAILTSTFLVISNLDSEETESLSVRAYADPIVDGLLAKAVAQISFDRQTTVAAGPYGAMLTNSNGLGSFIDCPRPYDNTETTDPWLSTSYVSGEGISGQLTNLDGPDNAGACAGQTFAETANPNIDYPKGQSGDYIDADCDGIPDAALVNSNISSPLNDANTYYYGVRIVDLSSRMCINTASGWDSSESQYDRPSGSGPDMIDLRNFLDKRAGTSAPIPIYPVLNAGDIANGVKGRIGDVSPATGGTAASPAPASTKGYGRYCGAYLLSPGKGYQPFGIGDEVFFLNACAYLDNTSQFGGRINRLIFPLSTATSSPLSDSIRRQLTTINCVSSAVRWPNAFPEPLAINAVQSVGDCQAVYHRMKLMLEATGIGMTDDDRTTMAAHFAANLWAYCSYANLGEPWAFQPDDRPNLVVYGLRQDMVITQVFARHISNSKFDANDTEKTKDDSAWGYALELSNPTESSLMYGSYELELKSQDGTTAVVPLRGTGLPFLAAPAVNATAPTKRVVYGCGGGLARPMTTLAQQGQLFGETPSATTWYLDNKMDFRKSTGSLSITLYHKFGDVRVPIDFVTVGNNDSFDLPYDTNLKPDDIAGDYPGKKPPTKTDNPCVYIRRDDRLKTATTRLARFNLAVYKCDGPTESTGSLTATKLGISSGTGNAITENDFNRCTYASVNPPPVYSPGIYRPRNITISGTPSARESMPQDDYFLPSLADLDNIYFAGSFRNGATEGPFTTGILRTARSVVFTDRADRGRMPTVDIATPDVGNCAQASGRYPDIPQGFLFHEFFTRTPGHLARPNEKKRMYGLININTLAIPSNITAATGVNCAVWWLPWPTDSTAGSLALNYGNRLALGQSGLNYARNAAISAIRQYRDQAGRAGSTGIAGLRSFSGSDVAGFMTPGEVGIPLAKYMDTLLKASSADCEKDADYIRARNCLFGYISDSISTRSDVYACYITVQHGKNASGRRWRYVAVIDRSNVMTPTDKAAVLLVSQLR